MIGARRGMTLLEVLVAVAVLATGVVGAERLLARSVSAVATDASLTRAMLLARALLAEAELAPPETGHQTGDLGAQGGAGFRFERDVTATPHPGLREVRVRVAPVAGEGVPCELVELIRVPPS
jgi:type II secretion system protein I